VGSWSISSLCQWQAGAWGVGLVELEVSLSKNF